MNTLWPWRDLTLIPSPRREVDPVVQEGERPTIFQTLCASGMHDLNVTSCWCHLHETEPGGEVRSPGRMKISLEYL
jgi:hypothetical protein